MAAMQRKQKWENWPVLASGVLLVAGLFIVADTILDKHRTPHDFVVHLAGALAAIIISIATYDEWERRHERKRYLPPEKMGVRRVQEELFQLLYQYAFVLNLRFNPQSRALHTVDKATSSQRFTRSKDELKAKAAKHISQTDKQLKGDLFNVSKEALRKPKLDKQSYNDVSQLLIQTEHAIRQIDLAIATYGYSFTPEIHKWALDVREGVSQAITGKLSILSIRLAAISKNSDKLLDESTSSGFKDTVNELIAAGQKAKNVKVEK